MEAVKVPERGPSDGRKKTTPQQVIEWRRLVEEEGWTVKAVADKAHVQARTIRLALDRDAARSDYRMAQQERLRGAIEAHDRDLLDEADRLRRAVTWHPYSLVPEESLARKRYQALIAHLKRLNLQSSLNRWEQLVLRYHRAVPDLEEKLREVVKVSDALSVVGGVSRLMTDANTLVQGGRPVSFEYHLDGRTLRDGATGILDEVESMDDPRAKRACAEIERLEEELRGFEELRELRAIYLDWERLHEKLVGAMEDITLRQLLPGRCNWCPGEP